MEDNPEAPLTPDWVWLNNANVHVTKDRGWFKTYTPFKSKVNTNPFATTGSYKDVLGVGTVEIPVERSPDLSGTESHGVLVLEDVLHAPGITGMEKFKATKASASTSDSTEPKASRGVPPYTDEEQALIVKQYRSEFHFLQDLGLSIHKDEDREEGRRALRIFKHAADHPSEDESEDDEFDFTGHQVDYAFTSTELEKIEKHYKNAEQFMVTYGLKFYDDGDIQEAKTVVTAMMTDDNE